MFLEIFSAGLSQSMIPWTTKPELQTGPQKCVVFGPTGELINAARAALILSSLFDLFFLK